MKKSTLTSDITALINCFNCTRSAGFNVDFVENDSDIRVYINLHTNKKCMKPTQCKVESKANVNGLVLGGYHC